jgi:hypothetical protein
MVASWSEHEAQNFGLETTLDYDTVRAFRRVRRAWGFAASGGEIPQLIQPIRHYLAAVGRNNAVQIMRFDSDHGTDRAGSRHSWASHKGQFGIPRRPGIVLWTFLTHSMAAQFAHLL